VHVVIEASHLPGRRRGPDSEGRWYENVHVGLCSRSADAVAVVVPGRPWLAVGLVPGDTPEARWEFDITVKPAAGMTDFGGPFVRGNRGDRHIGFASGDLLANGTLHLLAGAKLRLDDVEPDTLRAAGQAGHRLIARLALTGPRSGPRGASIRPPDVVWSAEPV